MVVDGHSAWIGGLNVGDEYLGRDQKVGAWRDTHVKLTGPSVSGAQITFLEDWHWATHEVLPSAMGNGACLNWRSMHRSLRAIWSCGFTRDLHLVLPACDQLRKERLWIASPYFVPDEQFISALQLAALRGVDVRILIPYKSDNKLVQLSIWSDVAELEAVGIRMFKHRQGFSASKSHAHR